MGQRGALAVGRMTALDQESAVECAQRVRAACAQLDDVGDFARREPGGNWTGHAAAAYRERIRRQVQATDAMSLRLREAATAFERYAAQLVAGDDAAAAGVSLLSALAQLRPTPSAGAVDQSDPGDEALATCPRDGTPHQIHEWWLGLSDRHREALLVVAPGVIGALNGLPASVRSLANRVALTRDLAAGRWRKGHGALTPAQRSALRNSTQTERALDDLAERGLPSQLYLYDPDAFAGDGEVAIGVGDLDDSQHLGIFVPGFGHDGGDVRSVSERAGNLYQAADTASDDSIAVLGWLGYDSPDNLLPWGSDLDALSVATADAAKAGGGELDDLVVGFRTADTDGRVHITAIGHSYGSTTLGQSAHDHHLAVDDLVFVGSPGLGPGVDHVSDLGLDAERVWVGANSRDPVPKLGDHGWANPGTLGIGLGNDPAEDDFAAQRFQAESVTRAPDDTSVTAIEDHSKYFDHDTESLSNQAYVLVGQPERVVIAEPIKDTWRDDPQDPEWERMPTRIPTR